MSAATNSIDDVITCDESTSLWPAMVTVGSVLLGYLVGRISYGRDLRTPLRRIEQSSERIEISIWTL
jgi:hypothetical protein